MIQKCCNSLCCFFCCLPSTTNTNSNNSKIKSKNRAKHRILTRVHMCGVLSAQIIVSAILIAIALWLVVRPQEPAVYLTGMEVEAIDKYMNKPNSTLLHYNLTLRNTDLYKFVHYDVLVLRFTYSAYSSKYGMTINFDESGDGLSQRPGKKTLLGNHTLDYSVATADWWNTGLVNLVKLKTSINLKFAMIVRYKAFNKLDITSRQYTKVASVYFDDDGKAIINKHGGLRLK